MRKPNFILLSFIFPVLIFQQFINSASLIPVINSVSLSEILAQDPKLLRVFDKVGPFSPSRRRFRRRRGRIRWLHGRTRRIRWLRSAAVHHDKVHELHRQIRGRWRQRPSPPPSSVGDLLPCVLLLHQGSPARRLGSVVLGWTSGCCAGCTTRRTSGRRCSRGSSTRSARRRRRRLRRTCRTWSPRIRSPTRTRGARRARPNRRSWTTTRCR